MYRTAHLTEEQFTGYQLRTLAPADLHSADTHLAGCSACREHLLRAAHGTGLIGELRAQLSEHLDYDDVVACAEGTAPAAIQQHLAECDLCRADVDDLRQFRSELNASPRDTKPAAVVTMPGRPARQSWPKWAAVAAGIVVLAGLSFWSVNRPAPPPSTVSPGVVAQVAPKEPELTGEQKAALAAVRGTGKFARAEVLDRLVTHRGVLLGAAPEASTFDIAGPMGTTVMADRPVFRWQAVPGASRYVVAVFDDTFRKLAESPALTAAEWQPAQPLERGKILNWQVTAQVGGTKLRAPLPPAPEARFQVAEADQVAQIENARRDHPANHLLLAVLMARTGALDDAERELDTLASTDAATAQSLRQSLQEMRKK